MTLAFLLAPPDFSDDAPPTRGRTGRPASDDAPRPDDVALANGIRAGDGIAYEAAIRAYYGWLHGVAMSYVRSEVVAEEVVDGVFERIWQRRATLAPGTRLGVYLLVAVRHAALDAVRHASTVRRLTADDTMSPGMGNAPERADLALEHDELVTTVWRAIESLPERARLVMMLRWHEQLDWPDIATALEVSVPAAQMQHTRALKLLRTQLPTYLADE